MIARAKESFVTRIPDGEGKIAPQVFHAWCAPSSVSVQKQFGVRSIWPNLSAGPLQLGDECHPVIEPGVCGNPKPPIEAGWLAFAQRFARGPQHRMAQPNWAIQPARAGIRATVR